MSANADIFRSRPIDKLGWDNSVDRIPAEKWTMSPVDASALEYDKHATNAFGSAWEPTIAQLITILGDDKVLIDYSCGTGQFTERLLQYCGDFVRILNVDVSPRYLRIAADRFRNDARVALRLLKKSSNGHSYEYVDDVLNDLISDREADILTCTNAIHLYPNLFETLGSWYRALRPGGFALVSTGDMSNPSREISGWRLHDTITTVNEIAKDIVRTEPLFQEYRDKVDDNGLMRKYDDLRNRVYPKTRPLEFYLESFSEAGLAPLHFFEKPINIRVEDFIEALVPYHEVVLGWVGGSLKVENVEATEAALRDRLFLIRYCSERLYSGRESFQCFWTYITCQKS